MPDYSIYEFNELVTDQELGNATLILGNGASMAVSSSFSYTNLFGKACNDSILNQTSKNFLILSIWNMASAYCTCISFMVLINDCLILS